MPILYSGPLNSSLDALLLKRRGMLLLIAALAGLALVLSAVGVYGMLAYDVSQRTREIGIRGALGATRGQIIGLILRQSLGKTALGLAIGLSGAVALSHTMQSLLFDLSATDPWTYAAVALVLLAVAVLASYLPARRAAKVDPIEALRAE